MKADCMNTESYPETHHMQCRVQWSVFYMIWHMGATSNFQRSIALKLEDVSGYNCKWNQTGMVTLLVGKNCVIISDPVFLQQPCKVSTFFHFLQTDRVWLAHAQACRIIPTSRALHWIRKTFSLRGCCQTGANVPSERKRALQTRVLSTAAAMLKPRLDYIIM